jgi:hypothetical protein
MNILSKTFDAVAFQRQVREEIDISTKGMNFEERKKKLIFQLRSLEKGSKNYCSPHNNIRSKLLTSMVTGIG